MAPYGSQARGHELGGPTLAPPQSLAQLEPALRCQHSRRPFSQARVGRPTWIDRLDSLLQTRAGRHRGQLAVRQRRITPCQVPIEIRDDRNSLTQGLQGATPQSVRARREAKVTKTTATQDVPVRHPGHHFETKRLARVSLDSIQHILQYAIAMHSREGAHKYDTRAS